VIGASVSYAKRTGSLITQLPQAQYHHTPVTSPAKVGLSEKSPTANTRDRDRVLAQSKKRKLHTSLLAETWASWLLFGMRSG